jgi:hypothetical protein
VSRLNELDLLQALIVYDTAAFKSTDVQIRTEHAIIAIRNRELEYDDICLAGVISEDPPSPLPVISPQYLLH